MQISKFLSLFISIISIFGNCSNANNNSESIIRMYFESNSKCKFELNGINKELNSIIELSNNINNITNEYFTVDSIDSIEQTNTILFYGFNNTNNKNYKLIIQGSSHFNPCIIFHYRDNQVDIPNIRLNDNIAILQIYSNVCDYPRSGKILYKYLNKITFKYKPISYFNTIEIMHEDNIDRSLIQNITTRFFDYSQIIFLFIFWKCANKILSYMYGN